MARHEVVRAARAQVEAAMSRAGVEYALGPAPPRPVHRASPTGGQDDGDADPIAGYARVGEHGRVLHTRGCTRVAEAGHATPLTRGEALRFAAMLGHRRCEVCEPDIGAPDRTPTSART